MSGSPGGTDKLYGFEKPKRTSSTDKHEMQAKTNKRRKGKTRERSTERDSFSQKAQKRGSQEADIKRNRRENEGRSREKVYNRKSRDTEIRRRSAEQSGEYNEKEKNRNKDRERRERGKRSSQDRHSKERSRISRDRERIRRTSREKDRNAKPERLSISRSPIREPLVLRDGRLDLTQAISEIMYSNSCVSKNFTALLCNNSNDSTSNGPSDTSSLDGKNKKKRSRWGGTENDKTYIPGMPTILPSTLDPSQQEAYLVQLQIEEISRKLRTGDLGIAQNPEERSPSPEPIYSSDGKRLNTREFRTRKRLEEQRHQLILRMQCMNPEFKPPADYKPPVIRVSDKVLIPQELHPDINFVGLLIGPRGNTLKAMEKETGAKIIIRGKGSVKEGKVGRKDGQPLPGEDEPLHAFITANNLDAVKKAVDKIKDVIRQGIEVPQGHNDLRRMQLRELAQLNGTLRETDIIRCANCGSSEHKTWLCPDKPNITINIVCTTCGGAGHISKDCRSKRSGTVGTSDDSQAKIDEEYLSLMAELGEGPTHTIKPVDPLVQAHLNRGYSLFDNIASNPKSIVSASGISDCASPASPIINSIPPPPLPPHSSLTSLPTVPPPVMRLPQWNSTNNLSLLSTMPSITTSSNIPLPITWPAPSQPPPPGGDTTIAPPGTTPTPPLSQWTGSASMPPPNFWTQTSQSTTGKSTVDGSCHNILQNLILPPPPPPGK